MGQAHVAINKINLYYLMIEQNNSLIINLNQIVINTNGLGSCVGHSELTKSNDYAKHNEAGGNVG